MVGGGGESARGGGEVLEDVLAIPTRVAKLVRAHNPMVWPPKGLRGHHVAVRHTSVHVCALFGVDWRIVQTERNAVATVPLVKDRLLVVGLVNVFLFEHHDVKVVRSWSGVEGCVRIGILAVIDVGHAAGCTALHNGYRPLVWIRRRLGLVTDFGGRERFLWRF